MREHRERWKDFFHKWIEKEIESWMDGEKNGNCF